MKQIDEIDARILETLLVESRTSFTEMAKKCNISIPSTKRRYERLKEKGVIASENMYLNPVSFGYESIAEVGIVANWADREKVIEPLKNIPNLSTATPELPLGKYNIIAIVNAKNLDQLTEIVGRIDRKPNIELLDVLIFADIWRSPWHPENIIVRPLERKKTLRRPYRPTNKPEPIPIDETDKQIAKLLIKNSRMPFSEIAQKVKISTKTAIRRYKHLRENNAINLSTIAIDIAKLGYNAILNSYIKVSPKGYLPEVETQLRQMANTVFCMKYVGGAYDLRIASIIAKFEDVFRLEKKLLSIKHIKTVEFYLGEIPFPLPQDLISMNLLD